MPAYRLYRLDGAGKILAAEWLEADDDQMAITSAIASANGDRCELWQKHRMIAKLPAEAG